MPRSARVVIPRLAHHVTHRGNNRQRIFHDDVDRWVYLAMIRAKAEEHDVQTLGWCLMDNHVHLVLVPAGEDGLELAVGQAHGQFSQRANKRHGRSGHLWSGRFFSCPMDDPHLVAAVRYVEQNPVRAGFMLSAEDYRWSSAAAHCGGVDPSGLIDPGEWRRHHAPDEWRAFLRVGGTSEIVETLRNCTRSGWFAADPVRVDLMEQVLGRPLGPRQRMNGGQPPLTIAGNC